jgi:hypothetical protein
MDGLLMELVLLKDLVWSMSYVLIKNLICSNLNYLGVWLMVISKTIRVSKIALKYLIRPYHCICE